MKRIGRKRGFKIIVPGFLALALALTAFGWYKSVSGLPNVIPLPNNRNSVLSQGQIIYINDGLGGLESSRDDTKIYLSGLKVFDVFQNAVTASTDEYGGPYQPSRFGNYIWASSYDLNAVCKLDGTTLQPLQPFQISPPAIPGRLKKWQIDWNEQFLYVYAQDDFQLHKFQLSNGQYTGLMIGDVDEFVLLPTPQFVYEIGHANASNVEMVDYLDEILSITRPGATLDKYNSINLTKIPGARFGAGSASEGIFSDVSTFHISPDGSRLYAVEKVGFWDESPYPIHSEEYKYNGIVCMDISTEEVVWLLNRDDGFMGLNGNADFDLSGRLMVAIGKRGSGDVHFINTQTKHFITVNVGALEVYSDVAVCTPKRTVYFSLPSQQALLEYPIPPGFLP